MLNRTAPRKDLLATTAKYGEAISAPSVEIVMHVNNEDTNYVGMFIEQWDGGLALYLIEHKKCYLLLDRFLLAEQATTARKVAKNTRKVTVDMDDEFDGFIPVCIHNRASKHMRDSAVVMSEL